MIKREHYLFILLSSVFLLGSYRQRIDYKGIKVAVKKVLYQSITDWNSGNIEASMRCYVHSESLQFDGNGGWELTKKTHPSEGLYTPLFQKISHGWRIVYNHSYSKIR